MFTVKCSRSFYALNMFASDYNDDDDYNNTNTNTNTTVISIAPPTV